MRYTLKKASIQGALGAACLMFAGALYALKDESTKDLFTAIHWLLWLISFTFFDYALKNLQGISDSNIHSIFRYAYNAFLAGLLCFIPIYIFDNSLSHLLFYIILPLMIIAVAIVWMSINLKIAKITECKAFSLYAALIIIKLIAFLTNDFSDAIGIDRVGQIKFFIYLANTILDIVIPCVLLIAWISIGNFTSEKKIRTNDTDSINSQENTIKFDMQNEVIQKAKQYGTTAACFMAITAILPYMIDFFPDLKEKSSSFAFTMSVFSFINFYKAFKEIKSLCQTNIMLIFHAYWAFGIAFVLSYVAMKSYEEDIFALLFFGLAITTLAVWSSLNFKLAKITQNILFIIYAISFVSSAILSTTVSLLQKTMDSPLYYADLALTVISQILLIAAWSQIKIVRNI